MRTLIKNIGNLVSGKLGDPVQKDTALVINDGKIVSIGREESAERVVDANGCTVIPGLIDGHVHPEFGDYTPTQKSIGWQREYLHGGVTTLISAGELHVPGLPLGTQDPELYTALSRVTFETFKRADVGGSRMVAGTILLVSGMTNEHFKQLADIGVNGAKFIFYDWSNAPMGEAERYVEELHELGMWVKIHSGGVSRSGSSRVAGSDIVLDVKPDIVGHISGGPIPMPVEDMKKIVTESEAYMELCYAGNPRMTIETLKYAESHGALDRVTVGTDTPSGTGVTPRAMLRNVLYLSSVGGLSASDAIALATGNTGKAHRLDIGILEPGRPADLVLCDKIQGSVGHDALDAISIGDLPGISMVLVNGEIVVSPRSEQTPPPVRGAKVIKELKNELKIGN